MAFTVTEPFKFEETQAVVLLFTVKVNGIEEPLAGALKLTVIFPDVPVKVPFVTAVIPEPEILYRLGEPTVLV